MANNRETVNDRDDVLTLYNNLKDDGYEDLGTADEFRQKVADRSMSDQLYNNLKEDGYEDLGTADEFFSRLNPVPNGELPEGVTTEGALDSVIKGLTPVDTGHSNATAAPEDAAPGSDLWRQRTVAVPGENPNNGRSYGEVYDQVIQDFGKNINHPDIDPYAEARAQIIQAGITDDLKPEQADALALNIREGYANQFAGANAKAMVSQLPDQVPNIDQLMDGMWYNRDLQAKLDKEAQRLGLSHENYVNFFMKPQLAKALSDRYGYDVNSAKSIAARLLSGEQHTMERVRQGEANDMVGRYAEPKIQHYFDRVLNAAGQQLNNEAQNLQITPTGNAGQMMGAALNYYHNTDPIKVWEKMEPEIQQMAKDIIDQEFILEADKRAGEEGVTIDQWIESRIEPYLLSQIQSKFEQMALEREMPKNTMDYLMANIRKSLLGQFGNAILASKARRRMQDEALARTEMGQGQYKPGFGARVAGGVAAMLPDMMYGGPFGLAAKTATAPVQGMSQYLIANGMRPLLARMLQSSAQGALSLGAFEGLKGGIGEMWNPSDYENIMEGSDRSAWEIFKDVMLNVVNGEDAKRFIKGAFENAMPSAAMGAAMIGGPLGQKVSNGRGVLANVLGWGTQVGVDAAAATALNIPKLISGEVTMEDLGNEFAQNFGTFAALGLNHKAKEFASLADGGRAWNGVEFTKKDIETLEGRYLQPLRKFITEVEKTQNRRGLIEQSSLGIEASQEQRDAIDSAGADMYRDLMHSYVVPRELKVKVAQALGMPIPEYALKPEVAELEKQATAKSIDLGWIDAMNYEYNKPGGVADKVRNGESLSNSELTMRLLFQDNEAFNQALLKQQNGEQLTNQEQELIATNQNRINQIFREYAKEESGRLAHLFEKEHGLQSGTLARMMKDAVEGKAVDNNLLNEYERMLRDYNQQLDDAVAQRDAQEAAAVEEQSAVETPEETVTETPVEEAPKINRVEDEASAVEEGQPIVNSLTNSIMEVETIDGRKAYIVDGVPIDGSLIKLVDEKGQPITVQDENGYSYDRFPLSMIKADEKGQPIINERSSEEAPKNEAPKTEEPKTEKVVNADNAPEETPASRIKTAEDGTELWEDATVEDAAAELRDRAGDDAVTIVDEQIADIESQLKELTKPAKGKKHMTMSERLGMKQAIKDGQKSLEFWNQVKAELEKPAETVVEPQPAAEPKVEDQKPATPTAEPAKPVEPAKPAQPAGPTAEQKIAQGTVKNNIGKRFGFQNQDGTRSEVVIDAFKGDDNVTVTRQDYDKNGQPKGEPYKQDLKLTDVSNSIINGLMKPALTTDEKLRKVFKVTVGDVPLADVLTEEEQRQLLDLIAKKDNEAVGNLTGDLIDAHHEDLILRSRDIRNAKVDQIMNSNVSREQKLRKVRDLYKGYQDAEVMLEDETLTPGTIEEYVADLHSRVPKKGEGPIAYFSYEKDGTPITGLQDETGYGKKNSGDADAFKPWLAPQGKGVSLMKYAEQIHSQLPEPIQEQYDVNQVRNAILSVFGGAERPSDITTMVIKRGILQAENAARRQEEMWIDGDPSMHKVSADDDSFTGRLTRAKEQTNTEPTEGQKEAGNYKKGHVSFGGYDFVVENPEGSMRRGEADGKKWEQKMNNTYGYILGRYGKDGDHLDMFINDQADLDNWNGKVYVVDQVNPKTGEFDEHKVMYGFDSEAEARDAYLSNYEKGWKGLGKITGVDKDTFDEWLDSSKRKRVPFAEHNIITSALKSEEKAEKQSASASEIDKALMNELVTETMAAGVPMVKNVAEGQAVLDAYNKLNGEASDADYSPKPQKVTDQQELDELNKGKTVKRYRAMQLIDGKLYPPMSAKVDGEMREPTEIGVWEKAEERPDLVKNGKFVLNKGQKGQGNVPAAYNPYFHTSTSGLNDQFTSAYKRPELVVVEVEIPESELTSGYKAEGAKDAVGNVDWHSGVVNGQLPADRQRQVTLSRYSKVNRIVPDSEVADMIAKQLEGTNVEVPYNVVTPAQRAELEKRGVKISDKPAGTVTEGINGNPIKQQKADVVDMFAKNVEMPLKPVEETIPQNPSVWEALNIKDRVEAMSPQELIDNYRRINSQMLEDGLDVDEHSEKVKADYIAKNGVKGLGQVMADDLNYLSNKYGFGKLSLRWDLQDRIKELGLEEYLNNDKPYDPNEKPAVSEKAKAEVVDMHGRPSFFKTPDGHAYGFTYQGKIYIDPRIATAETPIHEYGHLWAEMKRQTSPDEWNHIKDVLLRDEMVKPFIDKVKREYPELEGKDDAFAEEVLTQFSGKHGAEKLRKMAEEIKHELGDDAMAETIAQAAIRKVKSILNEFWKGVADMMGWHYTNAEDIADTILRDMLNGVNPTEKIAEGTDKAMKQQQEIERTLMGVHNLSEDKLRKVIKAGGLANPSLAVVDTNQGIHTSYGYISLIPKASLIDKRTGRNAGTFAGDAWTPTYPHVERMLTKQGEKRAAEIAKEVAGNDEDMARHIRSRIFDYFEGNGDRLHFLFLKQKGLNPQIRTERIAHSQDEYDDITKIFGEPTSNMPNRESITKEQNDALVDLMVSVYEKKLRDGIDPEKPLTEKMQNYLDSRVEEYRKNLLDDDGYIWFAKGDNFIYDNWRDEKRRQNPQPDWYGTDNDASYQVAKEGLAEEYEKWKESLLTDDEVEEKLFAGYTPSGNRRYLPNTVENASRLMNKNADQNAYDQGGFGPTRAMLLQNFASLADIRRHKDLIQKDEKVEERTKELSDELFDIINQISDMQKISDNRFSNIDYAEARLQEAMGKKNPIRHLNKEYGYNIPEDGELASQLMNFMEDVKNLPAKYFETKFKRPVTLDEFEIAVVPEGTSEDVVKALKDAGLDVRTFDNTGGEEVKKENRRKAVMDAVTDRDDILFQKKSEGEETLKDEESLRDSEKKERPLQEMPLKSSDRFNGDHVKGLEEYEDELRKKLADDSVERTADSNIVPSVSDNRVDGFWDERQAEEGLEAGSDRLHVGTPRQQDRRRLGLSQEERADIEAKLAAIEKEKERRKQAWEDFAKKYHVSDNGWIWYKDYLKAFEDMNTDPEAQRLMDKIFSVLEGDFGELSIKAGLNKRGSHSDGLFGDIEISQDWITRGVPDSEKAKTMLHELLHKVTHDNIELYSIPGFRKLMGKEAQAAVKELYAIHDALKERYPDIYGSKSVDEMVAEMGDADFRKALQDVTYDKNKNVTLWDRFKAAIKRLFTKDNGPEMASDADKAAMKALDKLLDAYDKNRSTFQRTVRTAKNVAKDVIFGDDSSQADNYYYSEESELTPENEQYWKQWEAAMKDWKERNNIPADAEAPGEKPEKRADEDMMSYLIRLAQYNRDKGVWYTAPKLEDYHLSHDDEKTADEAHENEKRYPESEHAKRWRIATDLARIRHAMSRQKAYDKSTVKAVTDFAQDFMKMGFGDNLRRGEMERMLSAVKNATGAKDIKKHVDTIMNILVDNQLRNLDQQIVKLSSIKELRQTAQGVERQGRLELKGQKMIQSFREARESRMTADEIKGRMAEVMENIVKHPDSDDMWEQEYEGLVIALQYAENIDGSRQEFKALDDEYKDAVKSYKESGRSYQAQQELLESLDKAMLENKIERIGSFGNIIGRLEGNIVASVEGAKKFLEREKQRTKRIQDMANFDLAGKDMGAQRKDTKGKPANFFLQPLATFEQMLRQFGARNANGEGYLYNYFMRNWMDATDKAYLGEKQAKDKLDAKAREVFGDKVKRWSDLYKIVMGLPTMDVEVADQGDKKTFTLTQGNLLYIYMANKMNDGAMKLRKMGIDEETVEKIKDFLDPRLVQLGDWLQDEYLPGKRVAYNKVHERMFGAPMAAIDHYFPIKILSDARVQEQDVNVPDSETLPSTITGNIIKRRKNALPLDILNTDALSLAIEHIEDMEHWAAQAEWNRDVNTLLSYTTFRNKVKNMKTIYGSGDALWNTFKDAAKMAAGTYNSSAKSGHIDKTISNIAKGVTAAKIAFRAYTALKQLLSAPAFLHDVDLKDFVWAGANPLGSFKWAMENMPVFEKRWKSRQMGDTRLMDDPTDWKLWKNNVVQLASRWGMSPNALVDGVTCAVGARAIYETRLKKYKEMGMEEDAAKKRALQDAEIGYNLTQQSSEGAFVSAIQKDRTVLANALSVFRNSSMAYTRQWVDAARNLKHRMQPGYKEDSIKFMTRQFQDQMGLDEAQAQEAAEAAYNRAGRHDVARLLNMMYGVTIAWNLGASLPYLLIGDDDKTKKEMMTDALMRGLTAGPTEGLAAGNIYSELMGRALSEQTRKAYDQQGLGAALDEAASQVADYEINPLPLFADIQSMIKKFGYDKWAFAQDVFNLVAQSAVGVNPQTFTDMYNAIMDYAAPGWDGTKYTYDAENMSRAKELALFFMRVMNAPTSSWRNKYIDELGMNAEDAQKLPYDEMAKRYAHYKHWKDAPIMGWMRGEEGRQEKMEKIQKQFDKAVQERLSRLSEDQMEKAYDATDNEAMRKQISKQEAKRKDSQDTMGTTTSKNEETKQAVDYYAKHRTWEDLTEDLELESIKRQLPKDSDKRKDIEEDQKAIKDARNSLTTDEAANEKVWEEIRSLRKEALDYARQK